MLKKKKKPKNLAAELVISNKIPGGTLRVKQGQAGLSGVKPGPVSLWWPLGCLLEPSLETTEWLHPPHLERPFLHPHIYWTPTHTSGRI